MEEKFIEDMLEEVIKTEIENLSYLSDGSDEKTMAVDNLVKLYKLKIEDDKLAIDYSNNESNDELECKRIREQIKDRYFKLGIAAAELMIPLIFYGVWISMGFKFEEEGTFTSPTFRGLFRHFKPTKK